VKLFPEMPLGC